MRPRRLRSDIVDHAVDAVDFVDDAGRNGAQEVHIEGIKISGHAIGRRHGPQSNDKVVGSPMAHDSDRPDRQENPKSLPDVVVLSAAADFLDVDLVRESKDIKLLARDRPRGAAWKRGTREWCRATQHTGH